LIFFYTPDGVRRIASVRVVDTLRSDQDQPVEFSIAPASYPTGTIHFEHEFLEAGQYVGLVTAKEAGIEQVGRFPFAVGKSWPTWLQAGWKILAVIALGVGLAVTLARRQEMSAARAGRRKA
jgi:hypothetical protein